MEMNKLKMGAVVDSKILNSWQYISLLTLIGMVIVQIAASKFIGDKNYVKRHYVFKFFL